MTHRGASRFNIAAIVLGLAFLYLPIAILVIYSFNNSRSVGVWGGWSLRWYRELFNDSAVLEAAWVSLRIALVSATAATILGTLAAVALTRIGRFRGRFAFSALMYMPLVLPEVIIGLALLLLFVAVDFNRGFWATALAHTTLTMCFVAAIVQARLIDFDRSLEEAAMDLGCSPLKTFLTVTLPLIMPAIVSGWMLAFTLSLDDFVIASFTTGPGATTLPIRIYSEVRLGVKPETNAICTLMIAGVALMVVAASLLSKRYAVVGRAQGARRAGVGWLIAARAGRAEQIDDKPHRHDHERAEQHIRQRPVERAAAEFGDVFGRDAGFANELVGRDAEMREDGSDDQGRDRHFHQGAQEVAEHEASPRPGRPLIRRCADDT